MAPTSLVLLLLVLLADIVISLVIFRYHSFFLFFIFFLFSTSVHPSSGPSSHPRKDASMFAASPHFIVLASRGKCLLDPIGVIKDFWEEPSEKLGPSKTQF